MPSGCARLPSCRGRKGDAPVKTSGAKPPPPKAKEAKDKAPAIAGGGTAKDIAPAPKKGKSAAARKGGPPPAAAAFLAKKRAEEEAAAAAAAAAVAGDVGERDSDDSQSGKEEEQVGLSLDTFDPVPEDQAGMLACVSGMPMDASAGEENWAAGLVRLILKQSGEAGFVVKIANDEDVCGVMSVANMNQAPAVPSLRQVGDFISAKCPASERQKFAGAIVGSTGLIISERTMETPVEVAVSLLISLLDEIKEAQTGQYKKLREKYGFDHYLLVTQAQKNKQAEGGAEDVPTAGAARAGGDETQGSVTWLKVEEEAFARCAAAQFDFDLPARPDGAGEVVGKVLLVKADQIDAVRKAALEMLGPEE